MAAPICDAPPLAKPAEAGLDAMGQVNEAPSFKASNALSLPEGAL